MFPENSTNLSLAGVFKWFFLIASIPLVMQAYQGIVVKETSSNAGSRRGQAGEFLTGNQAVAKGWEALGGAGLCWLIAAAIWYFWQRNEE